MDGLIATIASLSKVKKQSTSLTLEVMNIVIEERLKYLRKENRVKSFIKF